MTARLLLVLSFLFLAPAASGQGVLTLVSSSPADGTAGVALDTDVSFTFNLDLRTLTDEPDDVVSLISEDGEPPAATLSSDGRTVTFAFQHAPDTDYVWAVTSFAPGEDPEDFNIATFVRYTTASSLGAFTLGGTVSAGPDLGAEPNLARTVILLSETDPLSEEGFEAFNGAVADGSGTWSIPFLRTGVYYIVALNIIGSDEDERAPSFLVGLYDPDGDGVADPLTVNGDVAGLPVTLQTGVGGLSAQDGYPQAEARARAEATARLGTPPNDLAFLGLQGFGGVEVSGLAAESSIALWEYYFYSASAGLLVTVSPAIFGTTADIMEVPSGSTVPPPLPTPVGDAEAAARAALEVGGRVFLQQNPTAFFTLAAGDLAIEQSGLRDITEGEAPEPPEGPYWLALFFGFDINTFEERVLAVYLDYQTGAVLDTYAEGFAVSTEEPTLVPTEAVLHAAYPNPFNPGTSLSFTLAQAGPVRLAVYDALGREVAVLLDEQRSIGTHVQRWDAGALPSGPYFVQLVTSGGVQTRMLVLQK